MKASCNTSFDKEIDLTMGMMHIPLPNNSLNFLPICTIEYFVVLDLLRSEQVVVIHWERNCGLLYD